MEVVTLDKPQDIILKAVNEKRPDDWELFLLYRPEFEKTPFVVCWNYREHGDQSWHWGTYCKSLLDGLKDFILKCADADFTIVYDTLDGLPINPNLLKGRMQDSNGQDYLLKFKTVWDEKTKKQEDVNVTG